MSADDGERTRNYPMGEGVKDGDVYPGKRNERLP